MSLLSSILPTWLQLGKLPNPKLSFERVEHDVRETLPDTWEGFRFHLQRPLSQQISVEHQITLASPSEAPTYSYTFNYHQPSDVEGKDLNYVTTQVSKEGRVAARLQYAVSPSLTFRVQPQLSPEAHSSGVVLEADKKGSDWNANIRWVLPGTFEVGYLQSITKFCRLGTALFFAKKQGMSGTVFMFDRNDGSRQYTAVADPSLSSIKLMTSRKIEVIPNAGKDKLQLASSLELQYVPNTDRYEYNSWVGLLWRMYRGSGTFQMAVDIHGKVSMVLQEPVSEASRFQMCAELDHKKQQYKVGFGFQLQI